VEVQSIQVAAVEQALVDLRLVAVLGSDHLDYAEEEGGSYEDQHR
jgi:hypothetical protein